MKKQTHDYLEKRLLHKLIPLFHVNINKEADIIKDTKAILIDNLAFSSLFCRYIKYPINMIAPDEYNKPIDNLNINSYQLNKYKYPTLLSKVKTRAYAIKIPIKFIIDIIKINIPDRVYCFFSFNLNPTLYEHYFCFNIFDSKKQVIIYQLRTVSAQWAIPTTGTGN